MIDYSKLVVHYKYTKTMTIETRTAEHVLERWKTKHIFEFMENKPIEFHLSPEYTYNGKHYTQITLDMDISRTHKREGSTEKQMIEDLKNIMKNLKTDFHIEFTGNGYRIVSDVAWSDLELDKARQIALQNKELYPSLDAVTSFRKMPIARIGTNDTYRTILFVPKNQATNFGTLKSKSKKKPSEIMSKDVWLKLFETYWFPKKFLNSGGMDVIQRLFSRG